MTMLFNMARDAFKRASGKPVVEVPASIAAEPQEVPTFMSKMREAVGSATAVAESVDVDVPESEESPMAAAVDYNFLRKVEGFETKAYVPVSKGKVIDSSGVTVASGFDLGQHSAAEIKSLLPAGLAAKLLPYAGLKQDAALAKVKANPLTLTKAEAEEINTIVKGKKIEQVAKQFDAKSSVKFEELPAPWQTVIASVAFQYGDLSKRAPNFWKQVTNGDWDGAVANLKNFGDKYQSRRLQEAALVEKVRP